MFACSKVLKFKPVSLAGIAALLLMAGTSGTFGEPIQFSNTDQKPDATQEKKNSILQFRAYRPSQSVSRAPGIDEHTPMPAVPPPVVPSSRTSRQNQELLDRQKNWIFASPEDEKKTDSIEDALGIDEFSLDDEKSKSVVTKFLENKQSKDSKSSDTKSNGWDKDQKKQFGGPQTFGLGNEKQNQNGDSLQPDSLEKNFNEPAMRELSLRALWKEQNGPGAEKMRDDKQIRMNEFQSLFNAQGAPPVGGGFNTLQSANPLSAPGDSFNRSPTSFKAPEPFRNIPRPVAGIGVSAPPDINTRVFGQSAARVPVPEPPRSIQQPGVLPVPKRRF